MKLPPLPKSVWLLSTAAVLLPIATATAVVFARHRVAETTQVLQEVLRESSELEIRLQQLAARKPAIDAILAMQSTLEQRCADAQKPALVLAEMGATCDQAGIGVQSVRPTRNRPAIAGMRDADMPTTCELTLRADCVSLCRLLDRLPDTRLPLHVTSINVEADDSGPDKPFGTLRADVGIEAFQPKAKEAKERP